MHPPQLPPYELGVEGEQRDRLIGLALSGVKTMTSSLLVHQQMDGEDLALPGQRFALVDSAGRHGTVEIVEVRLLRLGDVGDDVAAGEGEGFREVPVTAYPNRGAGRPATAPRRGAVAARRP